MTDETKRAIVVFARRFAPDLTLPELAVHLHEPLRSVRRMARGITPEVVHKSREWRDAAGRLAASLYEHTELTREEIAEIAGVSRQHLATVQQEVERE